MRAVVIRSHGVPKRTEEALRNACGLLEDATCPHVKKIHRIADAVYREGTTVVVIGDRDHPEVKGIDGWCGGEAVIFSDPVELNLPENILRLNRADKILAVAQTTLNRRVWDECTKALLERYPDAKLNCTICSATSSRQTACRRVAEKSDAMIVIGRTQQFQQRGNCMKSLQRSAGTPYLSKIRAHLPLKELAEI